MSQPDRRALDDVVFEVLGLTAGEREAVYEAVIHLVRARSCLRREHDWQVAKAQSV